MPLSFIWSPNSGSQFQQPFNQFSISPRYKWLTVHLGAKNLGYNPFTLAGHTINGAGFDITPGKFRFGVMYGRFSQATVIDTITQSLQSVSFDRKGIAAHIGLGGTRTFIDFSAISARDDSASLNLLPSQVYKLYGQKVMPAENIALGLSARISFSRAFYWEGDGGVSIYTRDLTNTTKITNNAVAMLCKTLYTSMPHRSITRLFKPVLGYQAKNWGLKLKYQYIDPGYRTMGAYYINNDVQNITIAPSVFLFKRRVNIAA